MAQREIFEVEVVGDPTSITSSTNCSEVPCDGAGAFNTTPQEISGDETIPINTDNSFAPKPFVYDVQSQVNEHTHPAEVLQPTRQQLETMLQENSIIPFDYAYEHNNPSPLEVFDPYEAFIDYEDCMRMWCKTSVGEDAKSSAERVVSGDQIDGLSVDQILLLLPDTPPGLSWRVTPSSSVNYPVLVYCIQEMTSRHIRQMLKTHPYIGGPSDFKPKGRDYPVPGKYLHRLLDLGWITDEEAKLRWLDIDWFSLRDYRVHLTNKASGGNGSEGYVVVKRKRAVVFDGTMTTRERIWKDRKDVVGFKRLQMEANVLMSEGLDEDGVLAFYEECGAGYVTRLLTDDSERDHGVDGDVVLQGAIGGTVSSAVAPMPSSSQDSPDQHPSSDPLAFIGPNSVATTSRSVNDIHDGDDCDVDLMQIQNQMVVIQPDLSRGMAVDSQTFRALPVNSVSHKRKVDVVDVGADEGRHPKPKRRKVTSLHLPPRHGSDHAATPPPNRRHRARAPLPRIPATPLLRPIPLPDVEHTITPIASTSSSQFPAELVSSLDSPPAFSTLFSGMASTPQEPGIPTMWVSESDPTGESVDSLKPRLRRTARNRMRSKPS